MIRRRLPAPAPASGLPARGLPASGLLASGLLFSSLLAPGLLGCGGVPPEHTVTVPEAEPAPVAFTPDPGGEPLLADEPAPASAPLATYSPPVAYPEGPAGPDGCQNFSVDGLPVVRDCRRLAVSQPVAASSQTKAATQSAAAGDRAGGSAGGAREWQESRPAAQGRHRLAGTAAHLSVGEEDPSAFASVSDLFADKHPYWAYHPTLAPGSLVEIRNLRNGKRVRVNIYKGDPPKGYHGRIAVLNYAAALQIDLVRRGRDRVQLRVIRSGPR